MELTQTLHVEIELEPAQGFMRVNLDGHTIAGHVNASLPLLMQRIREMVAAASRAR